MSLKNLYERTDSEEAVRRVREIDFWSSTFMTPTPRYDPVLTTMFAAIIGSGGFTIGGVTIAYAEIASAIAMTAVTPGFRRLLK